MVSSRSMIQSASPVIPLVFTEKGHSIAPFSKCTRVRPRLVQLKAGEEWNAIILRILHSLGVCGSAPSKLPMGFHHTLWATGCA